jgi:hypothetical protein
MGRPYVYQRIQIGGRGVIGNDDILSAFTFVTMLVMLSFFLSPTAFSPLQSSANYDSLARPQFRLIDIWVLVVQIQLSAALVLSVEPDVESRAVGLIWFGVPLSFWWFGGVRLLTCAGIERSWHRIFFLSIVAPLGFLMAFALCSALLLLMFAVYALCAALVLRDFSPVVGLLVLSMVFGAIVGVLVLVRLTCQMMASESGTNGIA